METGKGEAADAGADAGKVDAAADAAKADAAGASARAGANATATGTTDASSAAGTSTAAAASTTQKSDDSGDPYSPGSIMPYYRAAHFAPQSPWDPKASGTVEKEYRPRPAKAKIYYEKLASP